MDVNVSNLVYFDKARQALEIAASIDDVLEIRDKFEALRAYVRQQGESFAMQNYCAEIKIRAERKAGEILAEMDKNRGGNPNLSHDVTGWPPKLSDLGIKRIESSRWQSMAGIPEQDFEQEIAEAKEKGEELTSAMMLRVAKEKEREAKRQELRASNQQNSCAVSDLSVLIADRIKFRTVYADPPWQYGNQATRASTDKHYSTMTTDEIAALPITQLVEDEAHLHLWTTNAFLFDAKEIIEAWGFDYKGVFVWVKPEMGIGNYWRVSHEFMLLGVRGGLTFLDRAQMSWIHAERTKHSVKPEKIRSIIELVSPGPFLELFGRQTIPGWTVWGNEIERTLFNESYFRGTGAEQF